MRILRLYLFIFSVVTYSWQTGMSFYVLRAATIIFVTSLLIIFSISYFFLLNCQKVVKYANCVFVGFFTIMFDKQKQ